jgi:hypothetical protein
MRKRATRTRSPVFTTIDQHGGWALATTARRTSATARSAARPAASAAPAATAAIRVDGSAPVACSARGHRRIVGAIEVRLVLLVDDLIGFFEVVPTLDHDRARVRGRLAF